ncbi:CPBP family intramembrane metalloprotease [Viridibacillus sp. YIM B01967]|uniref:CPBP family intramembrane metalloprotease n=1 Tax=Viridibacillus soli TaxID=2798301 RepID=A0ABS1H7H7_9BACL|nr:type II CAAX endopeptidase family protein [Viridibacillus soli]MBK3495358.1 CPBP family intramembrane metalloprotease [Viridibacillus soli]
MKNRANILVLILSLVFIYVLLYLSFDQKAVFWYLYTFTMLVGMAVSFAFGKIEDKIKTWEYLLFGVGYGTILYGLIALGYRLLPNLSNDLLISVNKFIETFGPSALWHYILLILIIAVAEELFWRGYVQQQLKQHMKAPYAVILAATLFAMSLAVSGFWLGVLAAFVTGVIFGFLYEWKKSMPIIIVSHIVMITLLFLLLPLH